MSVPPAFVGILNMSQPDVENNTAADEHHESFQILNDVDESGLFNRLFRIDLRSLALLRISLGVILVLTALEHLTNIQMFFSETGVLPQSLNQKFLGDGYWSLLWINQATEYANTLFALMAILGVVYALGYQTRWCNLICLVLLWSVQVRNPLITTGGDVLLRMLLFWSLFLPMSAVWSIDAQRSGRAPKRWQVSSVATMAIMLQIVYMYFFSGLSKLNPFWLTGDATEYALRLEMSVRPFGSWLAEQNNLLFFVTFAVLFAEIATLLVMFIPRLNHFSRGALMGFFWMMHLGIWLTMSIGMFSLTAIVAWFIFVPSDIWNLFFGQPVGYASNANYKEEESLFQRVAPLICTVFLVYITAQNIVFAAGPKTSQRFSSLERFGSATMTIQKFQMFAQPPVFSPWFEYSAVLQDGEKADIFNDRHKDVGDKPESVFTYMKSQSWRRTHWNLISHPLYPPSDELVYHAIRTRLLDIMIQRWNVEHFENPVSQAQLICHLDPIALRRINPEDRNVFANHEPLDLIWGSYENPETLRR